MIRRMDKIDLEAVMKIWLETNIKAHDFIPKEYWRENYDLVKSLLPRADVFVYDDEAGVKGFIGVADKNYVAGLFVSDKCQSKGVGSELLEKCKKKYSTLKLDVYAKNKDAVRFYRKHGFVLVREKENGDTGEVEYTMSWKAVS